MFPTLEFLGISIPGFGALVALGVLIGTYVGSVQFEEAGQPGENAWTISFFGLFGGLLGAKAWFVIERLLRDGGGDLATLLFAPGGLTWYGGLVGGFAGVVLGIRVLGYSFWETTHLVTVATLVAQGFGRIGCFMVGDDYGRPTELPWGIAFPLGLPPTQVPVHPTMLYESAWLFLGAAVLWRRRKRSPYLFAEFLVWTALGRFANEFLRINPAVLGPLSAAQLMALATGVVGAILWSWCRRNDPLGAFTAGSVPVRSSA
jgi:phosphatidylglycerol---prolipoprotein diacylglyceryl transferase